MGNTWQVLLCCGSPHMPQAGLVTPGYLQGRVQSQAEWRLGQCVRSGMHRAFHRSGQGEACSKKKLTWQCPGGKSAGRRGSLGNAPGGALP